MEQPGKPRDLTPDRPFRGLSQGRTEDLTAARAAKVLGRPDGGKRPSRRGEEGDPVTRRGGMMETLSYAVVLIVIIGFQILSSLDDGERSLLADPRITAITVDNRITDEQHEVRGNRLAIPDCPDGTPRLTVTGHEHQGFSLGRITVLSSVENGNWEFRADGWLAGGARVHVQARLDCRSAPSDNPDQSKNQ